MLATKHNSKNNSPIVTAILTCMTDLERSFVEEAIASIKTQSIACKLRIYVEKSNQWIKEIVQSDSMVTVRRVPLDPPGLIRNLGAKESDTEWIAFLDADDVWMPNKIECQLIAAKEHKLDVIATDNYFIDSDGKLIACGLGGKNVPMTSSWMAKRDLFIELPFGSKLTGEDSEWWHVSKSVKKARIHSFLIKYRLREQSLSAETSTKKKKMKILKASRLPAFRYVLIAGTWIANKFYPNS